MTQPPDPMEELLDEFLRKYRLVAGKVERGQGEGGRRSQPGSFPPLALDPVSEMHASEQSLRYHINRFNQILHPVKRIDITQATKTPENPEGARCPYCGIGKLIAWIRDYDPQDLNRTFQPDEVICLNWQHDIHALAAPEGGYPYRWTADQWRRLGVQVRAIDDERYTTLHQEAGTA